MSTGLFLAAAGLLVLAGLQKAADPAPLVRALRSVGLRVPAVAVRVIAVGEVLVGSSAVATGNGLGVAASYAGFTGFVLLARVRGGVLSSCGCFGKQDVPPTVGHALVTLGLGAASVPGATVTIDVALVVTACAVATTAYLVMTVLPLVQVR